MALTFKVQPEPIGSTAGFYDRNQHSQPNQFIRLYDRDCPVRHASPHGTEAPGAINYPPGAGPNQLLSRLFGNLFHRLGIPTGGCGPLRSSRSNCRQSISVTFGSDLRLLFEWNRRRFSLLRRDCSWPESFSLGTTPAYFW